MRLGIDSFSVRSQGWDAFQILDYASGLGLDNVHFSEREHLGGLDPDELRRVRDHADHLGIALEVGMRSFNRLAETFVATYGSGEDQLADMIDAATTVGSPIVRCFVGMASDRLRVAPSELIAETIGTLKAVAPKAEAANVVIAVENHGMGDLLAPELRDVVDAVASSHVGVCFDSGNPVYAAEDAVYAAEILAPYTVSTHLRDTKVWTVPEGAMVQWAPAGRGTVDLKRVVEIILAASPDVPIDLEVITGGRPSLIDFRNPESTLWSLYPDMTAQSFARFMVLAESGEPGPIEQILPPPGGGPLKEDVAEALRTQQREHFEESVAWCRAHLGAGTNA
ncbi:MAG TPA: sugar phosphate isomerase/epimerase [Thermomicrobiales bacterium]|nr:sugar phosphate isomerase/epimerase [Thermomicrobiales bacterium]